MTIPGDDWCPPRIKIQTSMGDIEVELYWKHAPKTCKNFAELARRGYYDKTKFHRVITDFMIQTGDPSGTGKGGSSIYGPMFEDEIHADLKHTGAGILSMANSFPLVTVVGGSQQPNNLFDGPHSNGSQYFITLAPCQWLDGKHTIFGRIHKGMTIVKKIGDVQTDASTDRPLQDIYVIEAHCIFDKR